MKTENRKELTRCKWTGNKPVMNEYHDHEWGVPLHDDQKLFEFLLLDTFQAGLSWQTILNKRENFRKAFADFDPVRISKFDRKKFESLMKDEGIIRNRLKIEAAIINAAQYLVVQKEFGSFDKYIWQFVNHKPIQNKWKVMEQVPASNAASDAMSRDMKKRGFKFCGTTICYAFMQAAGMINDHTTDCFRYREVLQMQNPEKIKI